MDYWLKQTHEQPLYPDLEWERPEQRDQRGRLLIVGGNLHSFAAPAQAYSVALDREVGYVRVVMPDALKNTVHKLLPDVEYAASNHSGSFAAKSLESILWHAQWANGILLPGDLGRNSETAIMLENLVKSTAIPLTLTRDALDYFTTNPAVIAQRPQTLIVGSFAQIQKLATSLKYKRALTFDMPLAQLVEALHDLTALHAFSCVTKIGKVLIVAADGFVATSPAEDEPEIWRLAAAARASTAWLHFPKKPFESFVQSLN